MADKTITSANSVLTITVPGLYPAPVQIRGYASDDAFMTDSLDLAEVQMGVDGKMSAGYVPKETVQTITLQADSPSVAIFTAIMQACKTQREVFFISANLSLPSTGESFTFTRGVLTSAKQAPDGKKVLQPRDFKITWERVDPSIL